MILKYVSFENRKGVRSQFLIFIRFMRLTTVRYRTCILSIFQSIYISIYLFGYIFLTTYLSICLSIYFYLSIDNSLCVYSIVINEGKVKNAYLFTIFFSVNKMENWTYLISIYLILFSMINDACGYTEDIPGNDKNIILCKLFSKYFFCV